MKKRIQNIFCAVRADHHFMEVMRGASSALLIQIFGTLLGFTVSVAIARMLGAEGSGVYYLALSVATIAATIGRVGFDNTVVRFIALHASVQEWGAVNEVYKVAMKIVAAASLLISVVLFLSAEWIADVLFDKPHMEIPLRLVSASILPLSLAMIQAESLRGLKNISASQWIKTVLTPLGTILLLYPLVNWLGVYGAVAAFVIAITVTAFAAGLMWKRAWKRMCGAAVKAQNGFSIEAIFFSNWPLFGVALTGLVMQQSATIFLGVWGTTEEVGIFNVANRVSSLLIFPLMAMISILGPKFSEIYRQGDMSTLKQLARSSSRTLTLVVVPVGLVAVLLADQIMAVFGQGFSSGSNILVILLIGVIINAITGPVGNLLMMTGNEKAVRNTAVLSAVVTIALLFLLVPSFGSKGAAIAITLGVVLQNLLMTLKVKKTLGFNPVRLI